MGSVTAALLLALLMCVLWLTYTLTIFLNVYRTSQTCSNEKRKTPVMAKSYAETAFSSEMSEDTLSGKAI